MKNPKSIKIRIYYGNIRGVSDRTAREILKSTSKICRSILYEEIDELMNTLKISRKERQSIKDRLVRNTNNLPVYYLDRMKPGSLVLDITLSAAILLPFYFLLNVTAKKTVEKSKYHDQLTSWLARRLDNIIDIILTKFKRSELLPGRARVRGASLEKIKNREIIYIDMEEIGDAEIHVRNKITEDYVIREIRKSMRSFNA